MKRTTIVADEETIYKIKRIAKAEGKSASEIIREALVEYIVEYEEENPFENPMLGLIGIAEDEAVEMDLSDGKDEEWLRENVHPRYGFTHKRDRE